MNDQICNTIDHSTDNIEIYLNYLKESNIVINTYLKKDNEKIKGESNSKDNYGDKEVIYTFKQNQFKEGKYGIFFEDEKEEEVESFEESITFINNELSIIQEAKTLQYLSESSIEFTFKEMITDDNRPLYVILKRNDDSTISFRSNSCTSNGKKLTCTFTLGSEDTTGDYTVYLVNQCNYEIETTNTISIINSDSYFITSISTSSVNNQNSGTVIIEYNKNIEKSINKISLVDKNNNEYDCSSSFSQFNSSITISSALSEGIYYIKTYFINTAFTFTSTQTLVIYHNTLSFSSISLEKQVFANVNSIQIIAGTQINYISILFNYSVFEGRITSITADSQENISFTLDKVNTHQINIDTSSIVFDKDTTFTIHLVEDSKTLSFTVNINTQNCFTIDNYIYIYNQTDMDVTINAPQSTKVYYKKDNNYIQITNRVNDKYVYHPTLLNEEVYFAYEENGIIKLHAFPVYITDDITTIIDLPFEDCMILSSDFTSISKSVKNGVKLQTSEFTYELKNSDSTNILNSNLSFTVSLQQGIYTFVIKRKDNIQLSTKSITFTTTTIDNSFISSSTAYIYMYDLTCPPKSKSLKLDESINLICDSSSSKPYTLTCAYQTDSIATYGTHKLFFMSKEFGTVKIYHSLSKEILTEIVPSYFNEGNNTISYSSTMYDLKLISITVNDVAIDKSSMKLCTENEIAFVCTLKNDACNIQLSSVENQKSVIKNVELDYSYYKTTLSYSITPDVFFINSETSIQFDIVFSTNKDLLEFIDVIFINNIKLSCTSKDLTIAACSYSIERKSQTLNVNIKNTEYKISIITYEFQGKKCSNLENNKVSILFTSPISLENYIGMNDVTMVKNDDNTFSLTYQTQTVIQKGDFIVRDQKLNKYTLNDIEFDLLSRKTCTADFYYGDNIDSYILFKFSEELQSSENSKIQISSKDCQCLIQKDRSYLRCNCPGIENTSLNDVKTIKNDCGTFTSITKTELHHVTKTCRIVSPENYVLTQNDGKVIIESSESTISSITFTDIKNNANTSNFVVSKESSVENKHYYAITFTTIGDFSIKGTIKNGNNNEEVYSSEILTVIDKDLVRKDKNEVYYYSRNYLSHIIEFNNTLSERRIKSIQSNDVSISYTINTNSILLTSLVFSNTLEGFDVTLTDILDQTMTLHFKKLPFDSIIISQLYYISNQHNIISLPSIKGYTFDEINSSKYNVQFTLQDSTTGTLAQTNTVTFNNGYDSLIFYYNGNSRNYITSNQIYFIDETKLPTKVLESTIYVKSGAVSYKLTFDKEVTLSYFTTFNIITLTPLSVNGASAIIQAPAILTKDRTINFKINNKSIQIDIKILECQPPQFSYTTNYVSSCILCSDIDKDKLYYYDGDNLCHSECPPGTYQYNYRCVDDCAVISEAPYMEESKCVSECSSDYGRITQYSNECKLCRTLTTGTIAIDGFCESECKQGALLNVNNTCVIPNILYENFTNENKCDDYCQNEGTCTLVNDDPYCSCPEGFYGVSCEIENTAASSHFTTVEDALFPTRDEKNNVNEELIVKVKDVKVALDVKGMIAYGIQNPDYFKNMNSDKKELIVKSTKKTLSSMIDNRNPHQNVFQLVGLALSVQLSKLGSSRNLRRLETVEETVDIIKQSHEALKILAQTDTNFKDGIANIISDQSHRIFYQYSKSSYSSLQEREKNCKESNLTVIDFAQCSELGGTSKYSIMTTDIIEVLREKLNYKIDSTLVSIQAENSTDDITLECSIEYMLALSLGMNITLYNEYISKGIDIYNANDKAFTEKCYFNKDLAYDTTASYRRKYIYQNKTIQLSEGCTYVNETKEHDYIVVKCNIGSNIGYTLIDDTPLENINDKERDVPITCPNKIDTITHNIGFWIYASCLFSIILFSTIFLIFISNNRDKMLVILKRDKIIKDSITFSKVSNTENVHTNAVAKPEDVKVEIKKSSVSADSFMMILFENFLELHPITSLTHPSIINPLILCWWIFITNSLNLFGFNALYFNDKKIEKRITHSDRDNFGYPMKHEFDKIIYSILTTLALNVVVRAIYLVTVSQRKDLESKVEGGKSLDEKEKSINEFVKSMLPRRLLAVIFLVIINVFFFYYVIVFCGIYINTQYGWAYSGVWSLFFNWVIFANIEIVIISLLEYKKVNEDVVYYLKKLFLF